MKIELYLKKIILKKLLSLSVKNPQSKLLGCKNTQSNKPLKTKWTSLFCLVGECSGTRVVNKHSILSLVIIHGTNQLQQTEGTISQYCIRKGTDGGVNSKNVIERKSQKLRSRNHLSRLPKSKSQE